MNVYRVGFEDFRALKSQRSPIRDKLFGILRSIGYFHVVLYVQIDLVSLILANNDLFRSYTINEPNFVLTCLQNLGPVLGCHYSAQAILLSPR